VIVIVMGVSGSGKTTVGSRLAERLGWPFHDGDDYHPPANKAKMASGVPLTDDDRAGWLAALVDLIREHIEAKGPAVLACSALKRQYRDQLRVGPEVRFVHLHGSQGLIAARMRLRKGHYMKATLLDSQFAALEPPEDALTLDVADPPEALVGRIVHTLIEKREDHHDAV
jgi:gluconokinase